ncbi:hypothetical protein AAC03nite_26570 [Alicyclobacillus acidoterrestris]|nr:hypothetical protein AAC03nite_26570 [Alicyclobacillus acidoterrestris]
MLRAKQDTFSLVLRERGWSQERLAKETGIDPAYLSRVLHQRANPSSRFLGGLLKTFPERRFEDFFEVS